MALEKDWPEAKSGEGIGEVQQQLRQRAEGLLEDFKSLALEITQVFLDAPFSALNEPYFAWAAYEVCNARLNLTYLLLFGVNAHHKTIHPTPNWQGS